MAKPQTTHVFMSYSRKDNDVMLRVANYLRQQGIKVWVDNEKLIPGTPVWEEEIEKAISSASALVVIMSPDAKNSQWVRREISLADQNNKRIFPVLVRGDEGSAISLRLTGRQYVDIQQKEQVGLRALVATLSSYLENEVDGLQDAKVEQGASVGADQVTSIPRHDQSGPQKKARVSSTVIAIGVIAVAAIASLLIGAIIFLPGLLRPITPTQYDPTNLPVSETSTNVPASEPAIQSQGDLPAPSPFSDITTKLVFGPQKGALDPNTAENLWATEAASVDVADFVATATFQNPFSASRGVWTHAIFFRDQYGTEQFRLIISMDQQWTLSESGTVNAIIQMGDIPNLRLGPDDSNTIWLYCQGDQGTFYLNGEYVADLDLSVRQNSGDIRVGRFLQGDESDGYSTSFQDFAVWEIP